MTPSLFDILFYVFAVVTVVSAAITCFSRNIVHAAFALLFAFFGIAGIYVLLSADFLAVSQLLIYVGGILVLLVFGVMLTNRIASVNLPGAKPARIPIAIVCAILMAGLITLSLTTHWISYKDKPWTASPWNKDAITATTSQIQGSVREVIDHSGSEGTSAELGKLMMTDYLLPFELVSVVLLISLIGAAMIARKEPLEHEQVEEYSANT